jgi:hypothetical protein
MTRAQVLVIIGGGAGSLGSIITAFSLNAVVRELDLARQFMGVTLEAISSQSRDVPVFTGLDRRFAKATRTSVWLVWIGVLLLAAGFILQPVSLVIS